MYRLSIIIANILLLTGNCLASQEQKNPTLIDACRTTNLDQVQMLLHSNTNTETCSHALIKVCSRNTHYGETWNKDHAIAIIQLLLEHGANPNTRNLRDRTAFDYLSYWQDNIFTENEFEALRQLFREYGYQEFGLF
jgi:ankyrin repeat protein